MCFYFIFHNFGKFDEFYLLSVDPAVPLVRQYFLKEPQEDYTGKAANGSPEHLKLI